MSNDAVQPLRHAARHHGTARLSPLLGDLTRCVGGVALFHQHRPVPAGHASNLFTEVPRLARPRSWVHDGLLSGGLRWSSLITAPVSAVHAMRTEMVALSRG